MVGQLTNGISDVSLAMFKCLKIFHWLLVLVFFITSSDSGSLVIDSITTGGKIDAPVPQRIF